MLQASQARQLLDSINTSTLVGLRDRAIIAVMVFSFARVGAVVGMNKEDHFQDVKRWWFRLHEKGEITFPFGVKRPGKMGYQIKV